MVIFHSYVKLPEGNPISQSFKSPWNDTSLLNRHYQYIPPADFCGCVFFFFFAWFFTGRMMNQPLAHYQHTLWWTNIAMERSTIFDGKIHYFYGHFQLLFVCSPEGIHEPTFNEVLAPLNVVTSMRQRKATHTDLSWFIGPSWIHHKSQLDDINQLSYPPTCLCWSQFLGNTWIISQSHMGYTWIYMDIPQECICFIYIYILLLTTSTLVI